MLTAHHGRHAARHDGRRPAALLTARPWQALRGALDLRRSRQALADLDDHLLRDIGLTRDEAREEAERPVWDAPATWMR